MERAEMRKFVKQKFQSLGFQPIKSNYYKIIDDDYLIGVTMDPSSYVKGYQFYCGMIYLPDERKMPFNGIFDISKQYVFPLTPDGDPNIQRCIDTMRINRILEYEKYTIEQLDSVLDANYEFYLKPMHDKEYGLQIIRNNWRHLWYQSPQKRAMLCQRAGLDLSAVNDFLNSQKSASSVLTEIIKEYGQLGVIAKTADLAELIDSKTEASPKAKKQGK